MSMQLTLSGWRTCTQQASKRRSQICHPRTTGRDLRRCRTCAHLRADPAAAGLPDSPRFLAHCYSPCSSVLPWCAGKIHSPWRRLHTSAPDRSNERCCKPCRWQPLAAVWRLRWRAIRPAGAVADWRARCAALHALVLIGGGAIAARIGDLLLANLDFDQILGQIAARAPQVDLEG